MAEQLLPLWLVTTLWVGKQLSLFLTVIKPLDK